METSKNNRREDLMRKNLTLAKVTVNALALLNISKQASADNSNRGWGKLLGYFDTETQTLLVEQAYGLILPKTDERMRKEDSMDDAIKKSLNQFSGNFRQVGFYIYSEDNDVFTYPILNYIINNEKFGQVKTLLHFSIQKARLGKNPLTFYEISQELNELLTLKKIDSEKSYYELDEDRMSLFDVGKNSLFQKVEFEIKKSAVFRKFMIDQSDVFENFTEKPRKEGGKLSENVTQNLNECIHKHAILLQQFIQNKKTQKKASLVNLIGSYERIRKTLVEKREIVEEINDKMNVIELKLNQNGN